MSGITITGYEPCHDRITGFGLREKNKPNIFGEDVGEIVVINDQGNSARIKLSSLLENLGCDKNFARDSISEKATLLDILEKNGYAPKVTVMLKENFTASADDKKLVHSLFTGRVPQNLEPQPKTNVMSVARNEARLLNTDGKDLKIAFAFYDKITALFSYATGGRPAALDKKTSYLQIIPNGIPIDLEAYSKKPPMTPLNPQGDLRTTEEFASLASMQFDPNGIVAIGNVEDSYDLIINSANSSQEPDTKAEQIIGKATNYLYKTTTVTDPFTGEKSETTGPSPEYAGYKEAKKKYEQAMENYIATKNTYDFSKPEDQRAWQRDRIRLQGEIDSCQDDLNSYKLVERALDVLQSYGNNAVRHVITTSKNQYNQTSVGSLMEGGKNYHISYGYPSTWYADDKGFSSFNFSTKEASEHYSHEATSYGGGASFSYGWLSLGGNYQRSTDETRQQLESSDFSFSFKIGLIPIQRPWMNTTLFTLDNWNIGGQPAGSVSKGGFPASDPNINKRTLPYYATALVIAKDIKITGKWGNSDLRLLKESVSGSASVSIGPFRLGGANYSKTTEKKDFHSTFSDGTFTVPGAQIIGATNVIVPFAAPDDGTHA